MVLGTRPASVVAVERSRRCSDDRRSVEQREDLDDEDVAYLESLDEEGED
jgi:hypothetical protein